MKKTNQSPLVLIIQEALILQLNHINYESTDIENDTEKKILVNMIEVESDSETVAYKCLFTIDLEVIRISIKCLFTIDLEVITSKK